MTELVFYRCSHCGNVAIKVYDQQVPLSCCGEEMEPLEAGVTDAALEKHVPVITRDGDKVTVAVGAVAHPMLEEHYITFIAAFADGKLTIRQLEAGQAPELTLIAKGPVTAFEYCNLHGLWKGVEE